LSEPDSSNRKQWLPLLVDNSSTVLRARNLRVARIFFAAAFSTALLDYSLQQSPRAGDYRVSPD
jgi:hypothetical protein